MNESISVMTDAGELVATPFAGGISVDINLPDGKGAASLRSSKPHRKGFMMTTRASSMFTYDGQDFEASPSHGRASTGMRALDPGEGRGGTQWYSIRDIGSWIPILSTLPTVGMRYAGSSSVPTPNSRVCPRVSTMPCSHSIPTDGISVRSNASAFDIPAKDLISSWVIFYCSSIFRFAAYASGVQGGPISRNGSARCISRPGGRPSPRHEISWHNCIQSTVDAFKLLPIRSVSSSSQRNNPANVSPGRQCGGIVFSRFRQAGRGHQT